MTTLKRHAVCIHLSQDHLRGRARRNRTSDRSWQESAVLQAPQPWTQTPCPPSFRAVSSSFLNMPRRRSSSRYAASFGAIIRRLREQRQWTLLTLSRKAGMNPTYIGFLERGENSPTLDTVILLAQVLGAEASDILREMEQQK